MLKTGYTGHLINLLRTSERYISLPTGELRKLGGVASCSDQLIETALGNMRAWMTLLVQSIQAEFPDYELCWSFQCLRLKPAPNSCTILSGLEKLAHVWHLNKAELISQYEDYHTYALKYRETLKDSHYSDFDAWAQSLARGSSRRSQLVNHPCETLQHIVVRLASFMGSSSSTCERDFADFVNMAAS